MSNINLIAARTARNDEFYTQYDDVAKELDAYWNYNPDVFRGKTILLPCDDPEQSNFTKYFARNFERFGLKKLISTSYAVESKKYKTGYQPTLFETSAPCFDLVETIKNGKIFILSHDRTGDQKINVDDLEWHYLEGDGDFRSAEIIALRDESDIIITNPPFSLFREFLAWIMEAEKQFVVIGNKNCVTYKEVFPLIKDNKMWSGRTEWSGGLWFETKDTDDVDKVIDGVNMKNVSSVWFTNLDHGRHHQPLPLMTMADNLRFSKHAQLKGKNAYDRYDNYDAIEVPFTDAIPSDYDGVMGVPISFLDKYCPEQFEILGITDRDDNSGMKTKDYTKQDAPNYNDLNRGGVIKIEGRYRLTYARVLIRRR